MVAARLDELRELLGPQLEATGANRPVGREQVRVQGVLRREERTADYRCCITDGLREFLLSVRDPSFQPAVSLHDARASLRVALAARQAAEEGRVVTLGATQQQP